MLDGLSSIPGLKEHIRQLQAYHDEIGKIGFILPGSIVKRYMRCGRAGCACLSDPQSLHGPYYEWTRKVHGKTVSVRLTEEEAVLLREWIENKNWFYRVVSKMEKIALKAVKLIRR